MFNLTLKLLSFLKVEYEYTDDADLIPDFQLTELDQNNQVKNKHIFKVI